MTIMSFTRIVMAILMTWLNLFNYTFNDYAYPAVSLYGAYVFCYFTGNSPEEQTIHLAVSTDGYNEISEFKVLELFAEKYDEKINSDSGKFRVKITQNALHGNGYSTPSYESDTVTFSTENGKFKYNISAFTQQGTYLITYADGIKGVKLSGTQGSPINTESDDETEKEFIK